jgi:hypothetical protein
MFYTTNYTIKYTESYAISQAYFSKIITLSTGKVKPALPIGVSCTYLLAYKKNLQTGRKLLSSILAEEKKSGES